MERGKVGIVCGKCETFNELDSSLCVNCGNKLDIVFLEIVRKAKEEQKKIKIEGIEKMEQAKYRICKNCYAPVPAGHQFCGKCGAQIDYIEREIETSYYGEILAPGTALLIVIKGIEEIQGASYLLNADKHYLGRGPGDIQIQINDSWLSPIHANFYYEDGKLFVKDEGSLNGIYYKISNPVKVEFGDMFMAGLQLFRIEEPSKSVMAPKSDGTYFLGSPHPPAPFKVVQILEGDRIGMVVHPKENVLVIGREGCDMNFPEDPYLSLRHLQIEKSSEGIILTDLGSKNGTFVRLKGVRQLKHGDYLFIGRELIRIETNISELT